MKISQKSISFIATIAIILLTIGKMGLFIIYCTFILNYGSKDVTITKSFFEAEYYTMIFAICATYYTLLLKR